MNESELPDEVLAQYWRDINWEKAQNKLTQWQKELTLATFANSHDSITKIQKRIVTDLDIRCLAVRHVAASSSGSGVDGVKWTTDGQKMRAAFLLTSRNYHAKPLRMILMKSKSNGKERRTGIPTYFDKAMNVLYGYSLIPVVEASAERRSFAFRPGRSIQDAHAYLEDSLIQPNAPEYIVYADIKAYYANIHHSWLLEHVPMDKKVLSEFLNAGHIFAGELFSSDGIGISEGANISPYLGNFVLDGLQDFINYGLFDSLWKEDFSDGNLIRFADDIIVTVRSYDKAEKVIRLIKSFLTERGLSLSEEKTRICHICEGFTFLSQTYRKEDGILTVHPSEKAVQKFISELHDTIVSYKKSQRELIALLNQKLRGWASYFKFCDAYRAFVQVDEAVQTALLEAAVLKHPRLPVQKIINRYWYTLPDGSHCYSLPDDRSIRVIKLKDTVLVKHRKVNIKKNPFADYEYIEERTGRREIENVSGKYKAIWERQCGRCFYCGRKILPDQPRTVIPFDPRFPPSIRNSMYIHKCCEINSFEMIYTMEDITNMRPFDMENILSEIAYLKDIGTRSTAELNEQWRYYRLKLYFSQKNCASITLRFSQIEKILESKLPEIARTNERWWHLGYGKMSIAETWTREGYILHLVDLEKKKITLKREKSDYSKIVLPKELAGKPIPNNAVFELEQHMQYIIKKYGL